jgi:predicted transporter
MKTLNALVGLVLVLYGNTVFLLSAPSASSGSAFGGFMLLEGLVFIIAGVIVAAMGLPKSTSS